MAPVSVAYLAGPLNAGPVFNLIGLSGCAAIVVGVRIHHPVAEATGLIVPLGQWVLDRACRDAVTFQRATPGSKSRAVSVNVSARQLQRPEIVDEVRNALRSSGLEPSCLVLEITESLMIEDLDLAIERLAQYGRLKELGCGYAQGFLLARPMPADALLELLQSRAPALASVS